MSLKIKKGACLKVRRKNFPSKLNDGNFQKEKKGEKRELEMAKSSQCLLFFSPK